MTVARQVLLFRHREVLGPFSAAAWESRLESLAFADSASLKFAGRTGHAVNFFQVTVLIEMTLPVWSEGIAIVWEHSRSCSEAQTKVDSQTCGAGYIIHASNSLQYKKIPAPAPYFPACTHPHPDAPPSFLAQLSLSAGRPIRAQSKIIQHS